MASERQIAANRRNAQKSTGPKSAAGKSFACLNALKHALTARSLFLPGEDAKQYAAILNDLIEEHKPVGPSEMMLINEAAEAWWLHQRARTVQDTYFQFTLGHAEEIAEKTKSGKEFSPMVALTGDLMTTDHKGLRDYTNLFRYIAHTQRVFNRAMQNLFQLRAIRLREWKQPPPPPSTAKPKPPVKETKREIGFVSQFRDVAGRDAQ